MNGKRVRLGFFSFTEVTDPAQHRAYNEWHQLDHMPEQFRLPGIVFGQRWVSTQACREARQASAALLDPAQYLTMYLITEPVDETLRAFMELAEDLQDQDRWFEARHSHLAGPFRVTDMSAAPRVRVSAEVLPWRPNRGVWVTVEEAEEIPGGFRQVFPRALEAPGVAGAWHFASGDRTVGVWFLDEDPVEVGPGLAEALGKRASTILSGPFETITPWRWDWFDP